MRYAKYFGAVICALLALGTLPSIYLIGTGLALGSVPDGEQLYFSGKLAVHIIFVGLLAYSSSRLWRSAKVP